MATQTTNYGLVKDAQEEYYNVDKVNANLDKIDAAIKAVDDKAVAADSRADDVETALNQRIDIEVTELNSDLSAVESDVADLKEAPFELPVTLAYGSWNGTAKPYTYVITNSNIDSRDIAVCPGSINDDAVLATSKAMILKVTKDAINHKLTLYAYGAKPTINIPILLKLKDNLENVVDGTNTLDNILTTSSVINNLTSDSTDLPLSSAMGKALKASITALEALQTIIQGVVTQVNGFTLDTRIFKCGKIAIYKPLISFPSTYKVWEWVKIGNLPTGFRPIIDYSIDAVLMDTASGITTNARFIFEADGEIFMYTTMNNFGGKSGVLNISFFVA